MLETRNMVPEIYSKSRDYQIILKLLDLISNAVKTDSDNFSDLLNPWLCKPEMLPLLAGYVGYDYDNNEAVDVNRIIVDGFPYLKRNRGCRTGIEYATHLAASASPYAGSPRRFSYSFRVGDETSDPLANKICIYVYTNNYYSKLYYLLEEVRPAGIPYEIIISTASDITEEIKLSDITIIAKYDFNTGLIIGISGNELDGMDTSDIDDGFISVWEEDKETLTDAIKNLDYSIIEESNIRYLYNASLDIKLPIISKRYEIDSSNRIGFGSVIEDDSEITEG